MDEQRELTLLLLQTAQHDAAAFHRLYKLTSTRLFAAALKILRDRSLAEEALQDGFVAAWRNAARFDPLAGAPMAWLSTIVRNRALDLIRRRGADFPLSPEEIGEAALGVAPSAEQNLLDLEISDTLRHCLEQLEGGQRQALALAYSHGLSHAELAVHLMQPLGTVKSWVRRGLAALKRCVEFCEGRHHEAV